MTNMTNVSMVALSNLRPGGESLNARKAKVPIDGLALSIETHGLLVPLIVTRVASSAGGVNSVSYGVIAGNRRLEALQSICPKGERDKTMIPCVITDLKEAGALEVSMIENVDRAGLHPVDKFEVFAALVAAGDTADNIARKRSMKVQHVRQALSLAAMAPEVRDAWRAGTISAESAEAFTMTIDHKAQAAALKKIGKHANAWAVKRELMREGDAESSIAAMLKLVGRNAYEAAGHQINATLFSDRDDDEGGVTVSDLAALNLMCSAKLQQRCDKLVADGWKWALVEQDAPKDFHAWRRIHESTYSKTQKVGMGAVVKLGYNGEVRVDYGYIRPGDKADAARTPKEKKAAAVKREKHKEETGGISNALAIRLSKQLTAAVRESITKGVGTVDALNIAIAILACVNKATPHLKLCSYADDDGRHGNDFEKYLKLCGGKTAAERSELLMTWIGAAIDLSSLNGQTLNSHLNPGKGENKSTRLIVEAISEPAYTKAALRAFDAADYFGSVSKELIVEAVSQAMGKLGKDHAAKVAKMAKAEAVKFALANVKNWLPPPLRHPRSSAR